MKGFITLETLPLVALAGLIFAIFLPMALRLRATRPIISIIIFIAIFGFAAFALDLYVGEVLGSMGKSLKIWQEILLFIFIIIIAAIIGTFLYIKKRSSSTMRQDTTDIKVFVHKHKKFLTYSCPRPLTRVRG